MKKIIIHGSLFDGRNERLRENCNIVVENNIVTDIFAGEFDPQEFEEIIDAAGKTVMPGLIDSHAHICFTAPVPVLATMRNDEFVIRSTRYAEEMLMRGITTIRDAGGETVGLKNCIDNGFVKGPRIFPSNAMISQTCGHADVRCYYSDEIWDGRHTNPLMRTGMFETCDGVPEVLKTVRRQLFLGASQIKIMASGGMGSFFDPLYTKQFTLEEMKAAVEAAKDYGTYVMAHIYTPETMERAAEAGVMSFEHATLMNEDNAKTIQEKGIWICVCPQFGGNGGMEVTRSKPRPGLLGTVPKKAKPSIETMKAGLEHQAELINKYDLKFLFGTDQFREEYVQDEPKDRQLADLHNFKKFYGNYRSLKAITGNFYELSKLTTYQNPYPDGKVGVLEEGSYADLLIIDGNPLDDVELLCDPDNMRLIMKNGTVYKNTL